jgi:hypothetical protein
VVTAFTGIPDEDAPLHPGDLLTGMRSPRERMRERRLEDRKALARFDVDVVHLNFVELAHRRDKDESGIVEDLTSTLSPLTQGRSCVVAPLGIGNNPNHVQVAAAISAIKEHWNVPVLWYADYPYAAWFSWPHWVRGVEPDPRLRPEVLWQEHLERARLGDGTVVELGERARTMKLEAFSQYRTQVPVIERGDLRAVSHPEHLRFEVYYES